MKRRSILRRIVDKFRGGKSAEAKPGPPATPPAEKPKRRRTDSSFEPLEGRIAPAVLLNASTVQFKDTNGDLVTVKFSKAIFKEDPSSPTPRQDLYDILDDLFLFKDGGNVRLAEDGGSTSESQELATLDVASLAVPFTLNPLNGANISITAEKQNGNGDGFVNVGYIKSAHGELTGTSLGKVVVDGDLGRIDAGDYKRAVAISSLTVQSMGALGTTTQLSGGNLESNVVSSIGSLTILDDFKDAIFRVLNGESETRTAGKIGKLVIGGDILTTASNSAANIGTIATEGSIGSVKVGNIFGGAGESSGVISANGTIGAVTIAGDIRGGAGKNSGQLVGTLGIGKTTLDTLWAGTGEGGGVIRSEGNIASVTLNEIHGHHTFTDGAAGKNAAVISAGGNLGALTVAKNISGGAGDASGRVVAGLTIGKVAIGGHLIGGNGAASGQVIAGVSIGSVSIDGESQVYTSIETVVGGTGVQEKQIINLGDVLGRPSEFKIVYSASSVSVEETTISLSSASTAAQIQDALNALPSIGVGGVTVAIQNGKIEITFTAEGQQSGSFEAKVTQASIVGSGGASSGSLASNGSLGKVTLKNVSNASAAIKAGNGEESGSIKAGGNLTALVLNGDLDGSGGGSIGSAGAIDVGGNLGSFTVNGDLLGGDGELTGSVGVGGTIGAIKVTGSLVGGDGASSASIIAAGKISSALLTGSLDGGEGANSASLVSGSDITVPGDFGKVTVLGQLLGDGVDSASIRAGGKLGTVVVGTKTLIPTTVVDGGLGSSSASIVGRTGIGSVTVNGHVEGGGGINSGTIQSSGKVASVKVLGNLVGGVGDGSGSIAATDIDNGLTVVPGDLAKVLIGGIIDGDFGVGSGQVRADGSIGSVTANGLTGDQGNESGSIIAGRGMSAFLNEFKTIGGIGSIVLNGSVSGGTGTDSGSIEAGARIGALTVKGGVTQATFETGRDFGTITIGGNLSDTLISSLGGAKATSRADLALGKLIVKGNVDTSLVRAGYDLFGNAVNGNAQIGTVQVTGSWTASSIAAGVQDVENDGFGDDDDVVIAGGTISKIASIIIGTTVTGTEAVDSDHFGFVAQTIGSVKIGGVAQALTSAKNTIPLAGTPDTNDTSIREVP